jgi:sensor histidine kinase regulating citrate/malate metabolism
MSEGHSPIENSGGYRDIPMDWIKDVSAAVVICDRKGVLTYLNDAAAAMYAPFGGYALLGKSVMEGCHKQKSSNDKMFEIMETRKPHTYSIERNGIKRLIHQMPHVVNGEVIGIIELAIIVPFEIPHFVRT